MCLSFEENDPSNYFRLRLEDFNEKKSTVVSLYNFLDLKFDEQTHDAFFHKFNNEKTRDSDLKGKT